ncbi:hypothetical protein [Actinokineospora terrae]|uniref:Uncharacterized protein n=1 Tax=Actinokineospora terrae TaxID=155974 RepID=A0A1H9R1A8_9PSEU|nr:hypothetical protein [Actinokineospora terrae]SER66631.1 hypothetical protein SAMN04487818_104539 [Actinokineospora terrae]
MHTALDVNTWAIVGPGCRITHVVNSHEDVSLHFGSEMDDAVEFVLTEDGLDRLVSVAATALADLRAARVLAGVVGQKS